MALTDEAILLEESHRSARILRCEHCEQLYVRLFLEQIDWVNGEDPQYWFVLPIDVEVAARIITEQCSDPVLHQVFVGKDCLMREFASGNDFISLRWRNVESLPRHD